MTVLIFVAALLGLLSFAVIINRVRGIRANYLDDWEPDEGEQVLFQDMHADTYIISANRARYVSYARPRRGAVIVTNVRILAGARTLFGKKRILQYVLYSGAAPDVYSGHIDGGLLTQGYQTFEYLPQATKHVVDAERPYVDLTLSPCARSSAHIECIRIYTDEAVRFPTSTSELTEL